MAETVETRAILRIENICKRFGDLQILDGITLDIPEGKITVIMGSSGHGKSTLLKILIGAIDSDLGSVYYNGDNLCEYDGDRWDAFRRLFGMVFQGAALFNSLTVGENVALPLREHSRLTESIIEKVVKIKLELVGLRGFEDMMPEMLSGGMKKRVALARAIALDPQIVFYDEPTSGLDPVTGSVIDQLILDLTKKLGITSVVISHDMISAFRIADYMAMLYEGKIIAQGTPEEMRENPDARLQQFVHGWADGPIPMSRSKGSYLEDLFGFEEPRTAPKL